MIHESDAQVQSALLEKEGARITGKLQPFEPRGDELYDQGDSAFEPLIVITAVIGAAALIRVISKTILEHKYPGGAVIDIRNDRVRYRNIPVLEKGTIVVASENGTEVFSIDKRDEVLPHLADLIKQIPDEQRFFPRLTVNRHRCRVVRAEQPCGCSPG